MRHLVGLAGRVIIGEFRSRLNDKLGRVLYSMHHALDLWRHPCPLLLGPFVCQLVRLVTHLVIVARDRNAPTERQHRDAAGKLPSRRPSAVRAES